MEKEESGDFLGLTVNVLQFQPSGLVAVRRHFA